jgi:hypothetical protein
MSSATSTHPLLGSLSAAERVRRRIIQPGGVERHCPPSGGHRLRGCEPATERMPGEGDAAFRLLVHDAAERLRLVELR